MAFGADHGGCSCVLEGYVLWHLVEVMTPLGFFCFFFEGCVVWHSVQVQMAVMLSVLYGVKC